MTGSVACPACRLSRLPNDLKRREGAPCKSGKGTRNLPNPFPKEWRMIDFDGTEFQIAFDYDANIVAQVKQIPRTRWHPRPARYWIAPLESCEAVQKFAGQSGIPLTEAACQGIELGRKRAKVARQEAEQRIAASCAAEAELEIAGLGGELRPFQAAGVRYALETRRCIIADEMGLGKTVQALATIQAASAYPAVIVCPASVIRNWEREAHKWLPGKTIVVLNGKRSAALDAAVYIVNYEQLSKWLPFLINSQPKAVICDESTYLKNHKARRTQLARDLARGAAYRLLLTGTPILNRPSELISQLDILDRLDDFGGLWTYAKRYCQARQTRYGWDMTGSSHLDELNQKLRASCFVRRRKADVATELPPRQRTEVPLDIDNRAEYRRAERETIQWLAEQAAQERAFVASIAHLSPEEQAQARDERARDAAWRARRAEQLVRIEALKRVAAAGKMVAIREWVADLLATGEKLVLFAVHRDVQQDLLVAFPDAAHVLGDDDVNVRQLNVDRFQSDSECRLIVCSLQAASMGLTLTAASNVAFVELGLHTGGP